MTKITDTQLIVLKAAAQRSTLLALPLPPNLKGGAAHKVMVRCLEGLEYPYTQRSAPSPSTTMWPRDVTMWFSST